jgi:sporulation protein YlmC with PRC-barrel domain
MKRANHICRNFTLALCGLGLTAALQAEDSEARLKVGDKELRGSAEQKHDQADHQGIGSMAVTKLNKARTLLGMDVRNHQNERLGEIEDLVFDLHSGKIAYAVLSVGGFLGLGEKYIAVPPNAFEAVPQDQHLVLNADKEKVNNAAGFAKSSWPEIGSSSWRAQSAYWLPDHVGKGTPGRLGSDIGADAEKSAGLVTEKNEVPANAAADYRPAPGAGKEDRSTFKGKITAVNPETRSMTVEGPAGTREFKFDDKAVITLKDSRNAGMSDLKVGFPVSVGYHEENGTCIAHSVTRTDTEEVR